jgi:hypothetical protein
MAQELDLCEPEITFTEFGIQLVLPQVLKHNAKMLCMLLLILGIYKNVVDENHDKLI